ncbi:MAG: glycosyltransferase family 2 protein [Candidatus Marinimicrobia bacterium]|nr:glycosyltransferase family 2 protein [Candidatus Neomarinimicrobiota bacterium]
MDVSIVIVNYNTHDVLRECLRSIFNYTQNISYEVIVIDNASNDRTVSMLRYELYGQLKLIENSRNVGFTIASNQGIDEAEGRYVCIINPDTLFHDNAVGQLVRFMDSHSEVGVCGPKLLYPDGSLQLSCGKSPSVWTTFCELYSLSRISPYLFGGYRYSWWNHNSIRDVHWVSGACLMIRRETARAVGGFDENMFMYEEDVDLCLRVKKRGQRVVYNPNVRIIHIGARSSRKHRAIAVLAGYNSKLYFFGKHVGKFSQKLVKIFLISSSIAKIIIWYFAIHDMERLTKIRGHLQAIRQILKLGSRSQIKQMS